MTAQNEYYNLYKTHCGTIHRHSAPVLNALREAEIERFATFGLPQSKTENYEHTRLDAALKINYGLNINRLQIPFNADNIFRCNVGGIGQHTLLVLNDSFVANPQQAPLPEGVVMGSLREAAAKFPHLVEPYYGKLSACQHDGLLALNGAFAQDGFFLYVPDNVVLEKPVQIINLMRSSVDTMANSRNLVVAGKNAKATVLVCDHAAEGVNLFANRATEIFVGENAIVEHYKLENTHARNVNIGALLVAQSAGSSFAANVITLFGGITHNCIDISLDGENARTQLCGIVTAAPCQQTSAVTSIRHNAPNCSSTEVFKYILEDGALCDFFGKIFVAPHAQKTNASQTNRNILLSDNARIFTRPQLEIYADDVRCSHGATTGQLDENALFYLRQRGIPQSEARLLLMLAFASEVLDNVSIEPLKDRLKRMVENRLRTGNNRASACAMCC